MSAPGVQASIPVASSNGIPHKKVAPTRALAQKPRSSERPLRNRKVGDEPPKLDVRLKNAPAGNPARRRPATN
jgi:hypothetical protein